MRVLEMRGARHEAACTPPRRAATRCPRATSSEAQCRKACFSALDRGAPPKSKPPRVKTGSLSALVQIFQNTVHAEEQMLKTYRTILHGTCLMGGRHEPGSQLARECPLLRVNKRRGIGNQGIDTGSPETRFPEAFSHEDLHSEFRDAGSKPELALSGARRRVGRPPSTEPSRHARYRRCHPDYRAREAARKCRPFAGQFP